jgi:hypothetical protein
LLIALAASLFFAPGIRADQTAAEVTDILIRGSWNLDPTRPNHLFAFSSDGTFSFYRNPTNAAFEIYPRLSGTWTFAGGVVTLVCNEGSKYFFRSPIDPNGTAGTDGTGKSWVLKRISLLPPPQLGNQEPPARSTRRGQPPAANPTPAPTPSSTPTPTPPISAETQQTASAIIQAHHDSLVFVNGAAAAGSGFIASINGGNFLVTNAHVAAGIRDAAFKTLDGATVQAGVPSVAVGEDIFCMAMPSGGAPFEVMQQVDANAAVGDDVVVLGNAEGGGVINTIIGKIVGIGPNLVEVDAPFVPGNSGSPIIHLKTGKVIGVATYTVTNEYDLTTNTKLKEPVVRRFGYRLDSVKRWQPVNWRAFDAQAEQMEKIETLTDDLYDFFKDLDENKMSVTLGRHNNPVIKNRIDDWLETKGNHPSAEDAADADASFISFLKIACMSDISAAQNQITYDYFRRELAEQKGTRDQMKDAFQQIIQGLTQ